jgi:lysozyme
MRISALGFFTDRWFNKTWPTEPDSCPAPEPLHVTDQAKGIIKRAEGYSPIPYICAAGVPTIGWGSTIAADGSPVTLDHPRITETEAQALFDRDINLFGGGVKKLITAPVNSNQYSALVSLAYNIGLGNLKASTLLRKLNRSDYLGCSAEFPKWRRANGQILRGLVIRREVERQLFLS